MAINSNSQLLTVVTRRVKCIFYRVSALPSCRSICLSQCNIISTNKTYNDAVYIKL